MNPLDWFLRHQVKVFPVSHGTKAPAVPRGTNWQDWDDFKRSRPARPYGVVLGSLIVIDGDSAAATAWIRANAPSTPFRVQTGPHHDGPTGHGVHFYYRAPGVPTPPFIYRDGLAIESRRAGQYVLGPGSLHPTGCTYKVSSDWTWRWDDIPILPGDFVFNDGSREVSPSGPSGGATGGGYVPPPGEVCSGERTDALFRWLRHCKANGMSMEQARAYVWMFNETRCTPPKSDTWFRNWFGRAWRHRDRADFQQVEAVVIDDELPIIIEESAS